MPSIIPRATWGARYADGYDTARTPANYLILHHSATPTPPADATGEFEQDQMRTLERIGQERFGSGMSYTFAVFPSGRIYQGVSIDRASAHTLNHNYDARTIVMVGNYQEGTPTNKMLDAIAWLAQHGHAVGWWSPNQISGGHRDFEKPGYTECPGAYGEAAVRSINTIIISQLIDAGDDMNKDEVKDALREVLGERFDAGGATPREFLKAWPTIIPLLTQIRSQVGAVQQIVTSLAGVEAVERNHVEGIASQIAVLQGNLAALMSWAGVEPTG